MAIPITSYRTVVDAVRIYRAVKNSRWLLTLDCGHQAEAWKKHVQPAPKHRTCPFCYAQIRDAKK